MPSSSASAPAAPAAGPTAAPHFPLLAILAACAAALAHKQLSSIPEHQHLSVVALLGAVAAGAYALLRTVLYATCESDPLAETGKLMRTFGVQEARQGIKVDRCVAAHAESSEWPGIY